MTSAWSGTLGALRQLADSGELVQAITDGYKAKFGSVSPSEQYSWKESIPATLNALSDPIFDSLYVLIEMQMPIGIGRADMILLGGQPENRRAYILELKQWSRWTIDETMQEVIVPGIGPQRYPTLQVLSYQGKLQLFHPLAARYQLRSAVFLHNLAPRYKNALENISSTYLKDATKLFCYDDQKALATDVINHLIPCDMNQSEYSAFDDAPYMQTEHLFDIFTSDIPNLEKDAMAVLAQWGLGLVHEQEDLATEILNAVSRGEECVFAIEGGPGSGKTLIAFTILLRALQRLFLGVPKSAALALRNNRLKAILDRCFKRYPGASDVIMFFGNSEEENLNDQHPNSRRRGIPGLADPAFPGKFRLVICDEAQRLRKENIEIVLKRAPVCLLFFDEKQLLNPPESGTKAEFERVCSSIGKPFKYRSLQGTIRCSGGLEYLEWVDILLNNPEEREILILQPSYWLDKYQFNVFSTPELMIKRLAALRDSQPDQQVALVAGFTESQGVKGKKNRNDDRNIRIGRKVARNSWPLYRDTDLCIRWLMEPEDYATFWLDKGNHQALGSNLLDRVASIYGAQGVESDYIGIFWGRDLVIRQGKWQLGSVGVCYDTIDGLVINDRQTGFKEWSQPLEKTRQLLINRYRIFLTRGIKGTFIFCEDRETLQYFLDIKRLRKERFGKIS